MSFMFPRYDSCSNFNTSRLSPSIYKFSVVSQFRLSSFTGLNVLSIGALARAMASFFPGQVSWYLSLLPSTISCDNSCFKSSKSITLVMFPFSSLASTITFGKSSAIFSTFFLCNILRFHY